MPGIGHKVLTLSKYKTGTEITTQGWNCFHTLNQRDHNTENWSHGSISTHLEQRKIWLLINNCHLPRENGKEHNCLIWQIKGWHMNLTWLAQITVIQLVSCLASILCSPFHSGELSLEVHYPVPCVSRCCMWRVLTCGMWTKELITSRPGLLRTCGWGTSLLVQ